MALLHPKHIPSSQFTWAGETRQFVADASDLGYRAGESPFGPVWDDACDEGLTLLSSRHPGKAIVFVVDHTEVNEGDVVYWDLVPASPRDKGCGFTVRIYND